MVMAESSEDDDEDYSRIIKRMRTVDQLVDCGTESLREMCAEVGIDASSNALDMATRVRRCAGVE
jgi:hypothetical protein